jgi:hypothetical protein
MTLSELISGWGAFSLGRRVIAADGKVGTVMAIRGRAMRKAKILWDGEICATMYGVGCSCQDLEDAGELEVVEGPDGFEVFQ